MKTVSFNKEITLGDVAHLLALVGAGVALWVNVNSRLAGLEAKSEDISKRVDRIESVAQQCAENNARMLGFLEVQKKNKL